MAKNHGKSDRFAEAFDVAFCFMNEALFDGQLDPCVITTARGASFYGYYWGNKLRDRHDVSKRLGEITLNPDTHPGRSDEEIVSTLVHEMCHHWQTTVGTPSRNGYHNLQWAEKMLQIGLRPVAIGKKAGCMTGQKVTHEIEPDGEFHHAFVRMAKTGFKVQWESLPESRGEKKEKKQKEKVCYECNCCEAKVWGKPGLNITCTDCEASFEPTEND